MGSRNALPEDFREVIHMLEAKRFPVEDAVSAIVPMEDAARMLGEWSETADEIYQDTGGDCASKTFVTNRSNKCRFRHR